MELSNEQRSELEDAISRAQDALEEASTQLNAFSITSDTAAAVLQELNATVEALQPWIQTLEEMD